MKILKTENFGLYFQEPVFILYPAAVLERTGHKVVVKDFVGGNQQSSECLRFLYDDDSDVYVFYTVFLSEKLDRYWFHKIREIKKDVKIIFMGPEPTSKPEEFVLDKNTYVIRGEPEHTIKELFENFNNPKIVRGITYSGKTQPRNNPPMPLIKDLDRIPFPSRHLINREDYYNFKLKKKPSTVMMASRNCWGKCNFCIPSSFTFSREIENKKHYGCKPKVGLRSPENIYKEAKMLKERGYKSIAFIDDNFVNGRERTIKICKLLEPLNFEMGCLSRADTLTDLSVCKWLKRAGFEWIDIGVESFTQEILNDTKKNIKVGDIFQSILNLKRVGIEPKINILLGASELETEETIRWNVRVLKMLDIDWVSFSVVIPHPKTEFYKKIRKKGWFATDSQDFEPVDTYKQSTVNFPNLSHEELEKWVKWCYKSYYLRPKYIWLRISRIRSFNEFIELMNTTMRLFS